MSDFRLAQIFLTYFVQSQRRWCTPNHSGQREPNTLLTRVTNGWIGLLPAFYIDQIHVVIVQIGFRFKWPIVAIKNRSNLNFNFASIWFRLPSCTFFLTLWSQVTFLCKYINFTYSDCFLCCSYWLLVMSLRPA